MFFRTFQETVNQRKGSSYNSGCQCSRSRGREWWEPIETREEPDRIWLEEYPWHSGLWQVGWPPSACLGLREDLESDQGMLILIYLVDALAHTSPCTCLCACVSLKDSRTDTG